MCYVDLCVDDERGISWETDIKLVANCGINNTLSSVK